ncbi:hypothetical protein D3C81_2022340 [compost metagenome]
MKLAMASGTLPSGSVSLASTLIGIDTPRVAMASLTATGGWLGATVMVTVVAAFAASPLASCAL